MLWVLMFITPNTRGCPYCLDEKLHEEPAQPAVVASRLVQACDLVVLVHGSHVPETRVKVRVPGGRTFMQDCVKRNRGQTYLA